MASTPEAKVKARLKKHLDAMGIYHFSPFQAGMGRAGVPDIIGCYRGMFVAFECKAGKNKPTLLQVREIETIRRCGGVAVVANEENWDMVRPLVRELSSKGKQ